MYVLYMDGSGSVKNPGEHYFILAGIAVFERSIYHLIGKADEFVSSLNLGGSDEIELHGSAIAGGRERPWKGLPRAARLQIIENGLRVLSESHWSVRAFAVAVHKEARSPHDPVEYAFEEICNRFNLFLARLFRTEEEKHRGLVVMDRSHCEETLQELARDFRVRGTRWGQLRNLAEVPLFVDSRASRLVQISDLLSWAVWRRYEHGDTRYFDRIANRFDKEGGVFHGLVHYRPPDEDCLCLACLSRARRGEYATRPSPAPDRS